MANAPLSLTESNRKTNAPNLSRPVGRPRAVSLPFVKPLSRPDKKPPGPARFYRITEDEFDEMKALCRRGTDPMTSAIKILGISDTSFKNWRNEAEREDGDDRYKRFMAELGQAFASCRVDATEKVTERDPLAALTRGPLGRSRPGYPGWTDEQVVRHTDPSGEGPPILRVKINIGRLGISSEVQRVPQLPAGDEDDE